MGEDIKNWQEDELVTDSSALYPPRDLSEMVAARCMCVPIIQDKVIGREVCYFLLFRSTAMADVMV